jgi:hypothetical protein
MGVAKQARGRMAEYLIGHFLVAVGRLADGKVAALALLTLSTGDCERYDNALTLFLSGHPLRTAAITHDAEVGCIRLERSLSLLAISATASPQASSSRTGIVPSAARKCWPPT